MTEIKCAAVENPFMKRMRGFHTHDAHFNVS